MRLFSVAGLFALSVLAGLMPAVHAAAATLLVANKSEASLTLLRAPGFETIATLATGVGPHEVAVSPSGEQALVTNYGSRDQPGASLTLVDVVGVGVRGTIVLPAAARPHGVEWLDDDTAVVTAEGLRSLLVVDVAAGEVRGQIAIDQDVAHMVATSPRSGRAYVANIGSGTATVVDLINSNKLADLKAGAGTEGIALVRNEAELWLANRDAGTVTVYDAKSLQALAEFPLAGVPIRIEADDLRGRVYITLARADAVAVIDVETRQEIQRLSFAIDADNSRQTALDSVAPGGSTPVGVLLSGDGAWLYIAHTNASVISVYNAETLAREALVPVGLEPDGMAWSWQDVPRRDTSQAYQTRPRAAD